MAPLRIQVSLSYCKVNFTFCQVYYKSFPMEPVGIQ